MPIPRWAEFCAVCGGPPRSDKFICTAGLNLTAPISTDWLDDWVGVTPEQPEQPISIGTYNYRGCFEQPRNDPGGRNWYDMPLRGIFATFHEWINYIDPWEREHDRRHGPAEQCDCEPPDEDEDFDCQFDGQFDPFAGMPCPATAPKPGMHYLEDWLDGDGDWVHYGVAFHRACGEVLQQQLGYAVSLNDVWPLLQKQKGLGLCSNHMHERSYGGTEQYHGKTRFLFAHVGPEDEYLLLDPRQCSSNADRIVAVWEPLVRQFRHKQRRRGTAEQAQSTAISSLQQRNQAGASTGRSVSRGRARGGGAAANSSRSPGSTTTTRVTRSATANRLKAAERPSPTLLQLIVSHAGTQHGQLRLTAQLLPLCSRMPQWLAGALNLAVTANTASRATELASWLSKYGGMLRNLDVEAVVDCCAKDAHKATTALTTGITAAVAANKALKLTSYKGHVADTDDAEHLLQTLPLQHLTSLHLTGPWELTAEGAAALSTATGLQELCMPGAGLPDTLTAADSGADAVSPPPNSLAAVLSVSLQHLTLTDAECISAEELTALGQQLTALTNLQLSYHPLEEGNDDAAALIGGGNTTALVPAVHQAWSELAALRSLQLGSRRVPQESALQMAYEEQQMTASETDMEPPRKPRLFIDSLKLDSIAALTGLTSLNLGSSAALDDDLDDDLENDPSGMQQLQQAVEPLASLQELGLTLQVPAAFEDADLASDAARQELMQTVAALPNLQSLTVSLSLYSDCLFELDYAAELTHLEVVHGGCVTESYESELKEFARRYPDVWVVCPEGVDNLELEEDTW